jgi:lipopolysaccharide transport protein LptA
MRKIFFFIFFFPLVNLAQDKITINNVDELSLGSKNGKKAKVCTGNVSFSQGDMTITCDKAFLYDDVNEVEAIGNVFITQPGTTVQGDNLYYYGNSKEAVLSNNVILNSEGSLLKTNTLRYNTASKYGYYSSGATIINQRDTLTSVFGSYSGFTKMYGFRKRVVLRNPEYVMESDTLQYHVPTSTAYFYGPTTITAENNIIECRYGWYNTETEKSLFTKGATIFSKKNTIRADSLLYDRNASIGRAFGHIRMIDSMEKVVIYGDKGIHYRNGNFTTISGFPLAKKAMEGEDSLWLVADTFNYYSSDSLRLLAAFRGASIMTLDMKGVCDSLIYNVTDSVINMYYKPVLWTEENEISGEYIQIHLRKNQINQMDIFDNGWIVQEEAPGHYNQIHGDTLYNYFVNNKLDNVLVYPNAKSIYYAKENDTAYTGVNVIECDRMRIKLDSQVVKKITFYGKPKAMLYPVNKIPADKLKLEGFILHTRHKLQCQQKKR